MGAQIFLSYSTEDGCEASLLQFAVEQLLVDLGATVWTYERDQKMSEREIGKALKQRVQESKAAIFLASPSTLAQGAAQWMELAYADAFEVPTFVLLHHLTYQAVKAREHGVPPLLLEGQCIPSHSWKRVVEELRSELNDSAGG